ncbi:hypothetical protein HPHPH41_1337 [Helicobacter pylori Hp H-41]|nr:hypothetical protein HPHPH41_1337 [Helicobacter pylori Hp H-41]
MLLYPNSRSFKWSRNTLSFNSFQIRLNNPLKRLKNPLIHWEQNYLNEKR